MTSSSKRAPLGLLVVTGLFASLVGLTGPTPAAASNHSPVQMSVGDVGSNRFPDGAPGGLGYTASYDVMGDIAPGEWLPTQRVEAGEHPEAFEGQWADAGFHAAWVAPRGELQFEPDAFTIESGYLDNRLRDDAAPLAPGDSFDIAVKQLAADTPLTWDRERGEATGAPAWEVATKLHKIAGSYGDAAGEMDVFFVRADLVARGGDFDARDSSVRLPELVIDLPETYGPEVQGSASTAQFAPYLQYISNLEGQVLPQAGKAVFTAQARGYIPEAREYTLPGGAHIREWHIPLNIVITLTRPADPTGTGVFASMPSGGLVKTFAPAGKTTTAVPAGSGVVTGSGLEPVVIPREGGPAGTDEDLPVTGVAGPGSLLDDIRATAPIDHTLGAPRRVEVGKGSYSLTVDPDLDGRGTLGIREYDHVRSGRRFLRTVAVPWVEVDGARIPLDRSNLKELRVVPFVDWIRIGFIARSDGRPLDTTSTIRERQGRIHEPGVWVEAVHHLGGDQYAFTEAWSLLEGGVAADSVSTSVVVRSLSDETAGIRALNYVELGDDGPVTYDGETMATEFAGPAKALFTRSGRTGFGATGGGQIVVTRAGSSISEVPVPDPSVSIDGQPVSVYLTSDTGSTTGFYRGVASAVVDDASSNPLQPIALGEACGGVQVEDAGGDAASGLDIERAWFDFDGQDLYSTIQVAELRPGAVGSPATFHSSWRYEHLGFGFRAERDVGGEWTYRLGIHGSSGAPWNQIRTASGELSFGAPGFIRMNHPVDVRFASGGFLDGQLLRDTGAVTYDSNGIADRAGGPAAEYAYGRGDDYRVTGCAPVLIETILDLQVFGTGSNRLLSATLQEAHGDRGVAGATILFFADGVEIGQAVTDEQGTATLAAPPRYRGGKQSFEAVFSGDGTHAESRARASS